MREVIPGKLWIGNARDARDVARVLLAGVTAIVDLAIEESPILYPRDVTSCRFPLLDGSGNSIAILRAAINTTGDLLKSRVPTLIACSGGMSRSPVIAAAGLMRATGITLPQALSEVLGTGPRDVAPGLWGEVQAIVADSPYGIGSFFGK